MSKLSSIIEGCFIGIILFVSLQLIFLSHQFCLALSPNATGNNHRRGHGSNFSFEVTNGDKYPLYFLVLAPYPDSEPFTPSWPGGPAVVPAAMVARDLINKREDILKDYTIHFLVKDSGCNVVTKAISNIIYGSFYSGKNIVGIIGPACSEATLAIAPLMTDSKFNLLQIAPTATSPRLKDVDLYPNTFRPIASALDFVNLYLSVIENKNYQKVGAIYEELRTYQTAVYSRFEAALHERGVQLTSFGIMDIYSSINEFRNNIRIIFVFSSLEFARNLLCSALKQDMLYPKYQFYFINRVPSNFITDVQYDLEGYSYQCSQKDMEKAVIGVLFAHFRLTRHDKDIITDARISYNRFSEEYSEALDLHLESLGLTRAIKTKHHSNYFDATWALSLSLNNSLSRLRERGLSLSNYTYKMPEITQIVKEELLKLSFEGMRGRVAFSEKTHDGANHTVFQIYQVLGKGGNYSIVGEYDPLRVTQLDLFSNELLLDQDGFDLVYLRPHISLGILATTAAALLILVTLVCHILTIIWRQHKTVKATSPRLNHLIFAGCYLSLIGAIIYTVSFVFVSVSETNGVVFHVHCSILLWTGTMTHSLIFGTLCVKTWRIYCIFNKFNALPMEQLRDKTLIPVALFPLAVDVLVNAVWTAIDPLEFNVTRDQGSSLLAIAYCQTKQKNLTVVWALCVTIPKGLITIIVLYLAIAVRRVRMTEYKQTKSIAVLVFSLVLLTGILLPVFFIFQYMISPWAVSVRFVSLCLLEVGAVVLCLFLLLLPPLVPLIKKRTQ